MFRNELSLDRATSTDLPPCVCFRVSDRVVMSGSFVGRFC